MGTAYSETFARLAEPFHPDDVRVRSHDKAKYITARSVMNRLDEVLGPENWHAEFRPFGDHAILCTLKATLRSEDGREAYFEKQGIGARSTMSQKQGGKSDPGDDVKGGESDALKRAAVYLGIGRYLYNDGQVDFRGPDPREAHFPDADLRSASGDHNLGRIGKFISWCETHGHMQRAGALARSNYGKDSLSMLSPEQAEAVYALLKGTKALAEVPPPRPRERGEAAAPPAAEVRGPVNENGSPVAFGWPKSGAALFAWCRNLEAAYQVGLVKAVDAEFCRPGGWPTTWKEWAGDQVEVAATFVARIVAAQPGYDGQFAAKLPDAAAIRARIAAGAVALLKHHGAVAVSEMEVRQCVNGVALDLAAGWPAGETLGDFDTCEDVPKLRAVLDQIEKDLRESEEFTF